MHSLIRKPQNAPVAAFIAAAVLVATAVPAWLSQPLETRATTLLELGLRSECGVGMVREQEGAGEWECVRTKHPETFAEHELLQRRRVNSISAPYTAMPLAEGFTSAVAQREAMQGKQAISWKAGQVGVVNSSAAWSPYGISTLFVNDPRYSSVSGDGYVNNSGRIDSFDYDPVGKRLFASLGTGGIWMSTNLGQQWVSVGETMPSQVVGSVGWSAFEGTPATGSGGTIVVASGDPSFGGGDYAGLGAFWSNDLGKTWHLATGVPNGVLGFKVAVDHNNPNIVYLALSKGLFRSTDGGRSYANAKLPTSAECAGVTDVASKCQFANFVTDVVVKEKGGTVAGEAGGQVVAAVGYRAGQKALPDGTIASPGNGLYYSATGAPDSFALINNFGATNGLPTSFPPQMRVGRISLGAVTGAAQNHNYLYAMVQDAVLFNGGFPTLDLPEPLGSTASGALPIPLTSSLFNGLYISADFGQTWTLAADTNELANSPTSALTATGAATMYSPGVQAYYNLWIKPDPTVAMNGVPTRLAFGLEEVWSNIANLPQNGTLQAGPADYQVVGAYRGSTSVVVTANRSTTTHPDQHAGIWIPDTDGSGGVTLVVGNDGGAYVQHVSASSSVSQTAWGDGAQSGFNTLLPYGIAVAKDGVVWFGLQDNGSGKVAAANAGDDIATKGIYYETYGGDGFYVAVDPDNSDIAWEEYTMGDMRYTTDGGQNWTGNAPTLTGPAFDNFFLMDPTDAKHLMTAANEVVERNTGADGGAWTQVFSLGSNATNAQANSMTTLDLQGDNAYVAFCGICDLLNRTQFQFYNGLATNVGGDKPPKRLTGDGWHFAAIKGLPNRYINAIEIDPANPKIVYVALGGYANRQWVPPGSYLDTNTNIGVGHVFKSVDAGENFIDISGDLPDANATALLLRKGQLIVGMDIGLFISDKVEAGAVWAPMMNGMPNVPIGQLQIRPGSANDSELFVATYGRSIYHATLSDTPVVVPPGGPTPTIPVIGSPTPTGTTTQVAQGRFGGGAMGLWALLPLAAAGLRRRKSRLLLRALHKH